MGNFMATIYGKYRARRITQNIGTCEMGTKRQMEKGVVFGRDLLGYTVHHGVLAINQEEAPIIKAIFHMYTNEGKRNPRYCT